MPNPPELKTVRRGRPRRLPTPSLKVEEIMELRRIFEKTVRQVSEEIPRSRSMEFSEAVSDLRPWILNFLDCGYKPADFINMLDKSGFVTSLSEEAVKHLFFAAITKQTGGTQ